VSWGVVADKYKRRVVTAGIDGMTILLGALAGGNVKRIKKYGGDRGVEVSNWEGQGE